MQTRELGKSGLTVSAIGLGCMGMSEFYGPSDEAQSLATLHRAIEIGVTFWDTSDMYGTGHNERLRGPRAPGAARPGRPRHQVRHHPRRRRLLHRRRRPPRVCPAGLRGEPAAARGRSHRSLLPAPGRSEGADRGDGRRHGGAGARGQGAPSRPLRGGGGHAAPRGGGASHYRAPVRILPVEP